MPTIQPGTIVLSKAGRDAGRYFVVLSIDGDFCFIADGRLRTLAKPKRKRIKHLGVTKTLIDMPRACTDSGLRRLISEYKAQVTTD